MDKFQGFLGLSVLVVGLAAVVLAQEQLAQNSDVSKLFPLTVIHINDLHARFEETNMKSNTCTPENKKKNQCIAGIARVYYKIKQLLKEYEKKNAIYLNAGDNYQGTLWFNLLKWNVTAHFIKKLKPLAMTLGNHEFDCKPEGLQPYLTSLESAGIPTIVANLKKNGEPSLESNTILNTKKFVVGGKQIGIIGVLYDKTHEIAQTGKVLLTNAVEAVKKRAEELHKQGVKYIIVLSHCSLADDKKIAQAAGEYIDVIVGAHSHSFLYTKGSGVPYDKADVIEGNYPHIEISTNKRKIPIVQAKAYGKYVGRLTLYFDEAGEVKYYDGYPVYINQDVPQDPDILNELKPWRQMVIDRGSTVVANTEIDLEREPCRERECTLGVLVADAFVHRFKNATFKPFAMIQAGNFRNPIMKGKITNGDIIEAAPFGSTADIVRLKGEDLYKIAEHSFTLDDEGRTNCLQVAGMQIDIDRKRDFYHRVIDIKVMDNRKPDSTDLVPLDRKKDYYVVVPSYLAEGKDGFAWMRNATGRWGGPLDSDVLLDYVQTIKTVKSLSLNRVRICGINLKSDNCKK